MKKLLLALILVSCGTTLLTPELTTSTFYNKNFTAELVDSIITAENIDHLDSIAFFKDKKAFYEYFYRKDSMIIRFLDKGDSILVTKRINK